MPWPHRRSQHNRSPGPNLCCLSISFITYAQSSTARKGPQVKKWKPSRDSQSSFLPEISFPKTPSWQPTCIVNAGHQVLGQWELFVRLLLLWPRTTDLTHTHSKALWRSNLVNWDIKVPRDFPHLGVILSVNGQHLTMLCSWIHPQLKPLNSAGLGVGAGGSWNKEDRLHWLFWDLVVLLCSLQLSHEPIQVTLWPDLGKNWGP